MRFFKNLIRKAAAALVPSPNRASFALFALYAVVQLLYTGVVFYKHEFKLTDYTVALYFAEKLVFDFGVFFAGNLLLLRIFRRIGPALGYSLVYLLLMVVDTLVYYDSSTLLELHHLSLITPYSLASFAGPGSIGIVILFVAVVLALRRPLKRLAVTTTWSAVFRWAFLCVLIGLAHIPRHIAEIKKSDERLDKVIMVFRNAQLEYSAQNPVGSFMNDIVLRAVSEKLYTMKGSEKYREYMEDYNLVAERYSISSDLTPLKDLIEEYDLPLGDRSYESLGLGEIRRVVLVYVESLSMDLLSCYNDELPLEETPYLCSDEIKRRTFTNLRTSGSPTLQGLTVSFSSHPNYNIQKLTGDKLALPKILKRNGFETHFMRSASKFFANENIVFKKWGFDLIQAREDFYKRPELRKYIYGWGLEDRVLYDEVVSFLEKKRDKKVFVTVLGTDTHPLNGQRYFKHLEYPPLPKNHNKVYRGPHFFMKAVHAVDVDIERLVRRMREKDLLGEDTLLIISADHSCPPNAVTRRLPGHTRRSLGKVPFIIISGADLPKVDSSRPASQVDVAPTILHLMGLPVPRGYWGDSLFHEGKKNPAIGFHRDMVTIESPEGKKVLDMKHLRKDEDKEFERVFSTVIVD